MNLTFIGCLIIPLIVLIRLVLKEKHYSADYGIWASIISILSVLVLIVTSYFI
jgi:hypothetical protein